jgi:hypothetical protein
MNLETAVPARDETNTNAIIHFTTHPSPSRGVCTGVKG